MNSSTIKGALSSSFSSWIKPFEIEVEVYAMCTHIIVEGIITYSAD
jgi:hypothetical protein